MAGSKFCFHVEVDGIEPSSLMLVIEYACWFHMGREDAQRLSRSLNTRMPCCAVPFGLTARQTLPVPGVPASGAVQARFGSPQLPVQRQYPMPQVSLVGQSASASQSTPLCNGSM